MIEPIFETRFRDGSYGFRPGRGCHDALREVDRLIKDGYAHVVDADLASDFDSIRMIGWWRGSRRRSAMAGFSI